MLHAPLVTPASWERLFPGGTFEGEALFSEPMSRHTTLRLGGPADVFVEPAGLVNLQRVVRGLVAAEIPLTLVGGGSNLLVRDGGIRGVVLSLRNLRKFEIIASGGPDQEARVFVEAGVPLVMLLRQCAEQGLTGLEWLSGIPGCLGGAVRMNAGSFGSEMKDVLETVALMDGAGVIRRMSREAIPFVYRDWGLGEAGVVLSANLKLRRAPSADVLRRTTECLEEKRKRQPLGAFSAGSVFKNPAAGPAAWRLIDEAGFRGRTEGGIKVSEQHTNFLVNTGTGTAAEFIALMNRIRDAVETRTGIRLEPEVRILGEEGEGKE